MRGHPNQGCKRALHGYEVLETVPAGEGFWVDAYEAISLPARSGAPAYYDATRFDPLQSGFNLLSLGGTLTVSQFNANVNPAPGSAER